jgi:hypothetical protein
LGACSFFALWNYRRYICVLCDVADNICKVSKVNRFYTYICVCVYSEGHRGENIENKTKEKLHLYQRRIVGASIMDELVV